ncbi:hypothetical protein TeGR_g10887, partial [Tetraparma gracilis]
MTMQLQSESASLQAAARKTAEEQQQKMIAQQQAQIRKYQEQQRQQAESLKALQEQLKAFIKAKQEKQASESAALDTTPIIQHTSTQIEAIDAKLQNIQQTHADKKKMQATLQYADKIGRLQKENESLRAENHDLVVASNNSSTSFVYGLMELLLILQPNLVINAISSPSFELKPHFTNHPTSTLLFADISGYTALAQSLGAAGAGGTEALSSALDKFFGIAISSIYHFGGDVVKFCGDAILCVFSPDRTIS